MNCFQKRLSLLLLAGLLAGCGRANGPRLDMLHTVPFQYLSMVRLGMRERDLTKERPLQRVAAGEYFETAASFGVIYVISKGRLVGVIVPEKYGSDIAGKIAFTQHQQEAYRSFGVAAKCAFDVAAARRIALYQLQNGVHEVSLRSPAPSGAAEITRSFLLVPSAQWRKARPGGCDEAMKR